MSPICWTTQQYQSYLLNNTAIPDTSPTYAMTGVREIQVGQYEVCRYWLSSWLMRYETGAGHLKTDIHDSN
jgi:hypothetical protein